MCWILLRFSNGNAVCDYVERPDRRLGEYIDYWFTFGPRTIE